MPAESPVRGDVHAGFGGRAGETDRPKGRYRASARPHYKALAQLGPGDSSADSPIGWYLPRRYEHYYGGRFARDWVAAVTVVGWTSKS